MERQRGVKEGKKRGDTPHRYVFDSESSPETKN